MAYNKEMSTVKKMASLRNKIKKGKSKIESCAKEVDEWERQLSECRYQVNKDLFDELFETITESDYDLHEDDIKFLTAHWKEFFSLLSKIRVANYEFQMYHIDFLVNKLEDLQNMESDKDEKKIVKEHSAKAVIENIKDEKNIPTDNNVAADAVEHIEESTGDVTEKTAGYIDEDNATESAEENSFNTEPVKSNYDSNYYDNESDKKDSEEDLDDLDDYGSSGGGYRSAPLNIF